MSDRARRWDDCNGDPCTCPKPEPCPHAEQHCDLLSCPCGYRSPVRVKPPLPGRPQGRGWQGGAQIVERTPSGWWLRRTDMETVGAQHIELFEPNGNKVTETVRWR